MVQSEPSSKRMWKAGVAYTGLSWATDLYGQDDFSPLLDHSVAPLTVLPHRLKQSVFTEALALAPLYGKLVHEISKDPAFIEAALVHVSDAFTVHLVSIMKQVLVEGVKQKIAFGIHRSDYMIHQGEELQQVELNTISSAFAALSSRTGELHRYILSNWSTATPGQLDQLLPPPNPTLQRIPAAFARAIELYGASTNPLVVLMVVQPDERNSIDQRWIQYKLFEDYKITVIRRSLLEISQRGALDARGALVIDGKEVAVGYFRSGYTPNDYPTQKEWDGRLLLERSLAIKCPNIFYHLAGTKKVQQVLADKALLSRFLISPPECDRVFNSFTGLWSLDPGESQEQVSAAIAKPSDFVMKPQREGGGNLLANSEMVTALQTFSPEERSNYILMKRIVPRHQETYSLRDGAFNALSLAIAELGVFTLCLADDRTYSINEAGGWLLRTKDERVEDGGVASGRAYLDSPCLI